MDKEIIALPQIRDQVAEVLKKLNAISNDINGSYTPELHYVISTAILSCSRAEELIQETIDTAVKNDI